MGTGIERGLVVPSLGAGVAYLRRNWGWYLALGIVLVVAGLVAIGSPFFLTMTAVYVFGWVLIFSGIAQLVGAFWSKDWSGVFLALVSGLLSLVVGVIAIRHPGQADLALTALIAAFLIMGGLFRLIASIFLRFHGWIWAALSGAISLALGTWIYASLPVSALWVIGTFIGVDMVFQGWTWIMLALAARRHVRPGV